MSNMVNNMNLNIGDVVSISGKNINGKIVDFVNNGQYRIATKRGLMLADEHSIKPIYESATMLDESIINEGKLMKYAKEFFKKLEKKSKLTESLKQNDLEHLVSPYVSVDQYTSKLSEDNLTIAFFCNERDVASDLLDFLEKMYFMEIRDIEISDSLTEDNKYILYVEFDRNQQFPKVLVDIIDSINFLINKEIKDWDFVSFNMNKKMPLSVEAVKKYVRLTPLTMVTSEPTNEKNIKQESVVYRKDNYNRKFLDEGYISTNEMKKILEETEIDFEPSLDREVLEYNFPSAEVVMTETHAYIIHNEKIKKLGF